MKDFWQGKHVLITGDQGFVGSHLRKALIERGAKVTGFDIKNKLDVNDYDLLEEVVKRKRIQIIYHLAAEAIVENVHMRPRRAFMTNICGAWNIAEVCRLVKGIEMAIFASSDKAYGEHKKLPYKEDYLLLAKHPYEVSKSCADILVQSYFCNYNLPIAVTRCGNIYGCGDPNHCRLTPQAINCLLSGKTLKVRGYGKFIRDFVYIDDIVDGYIRIAELFKKRKLAGQIFNFGNDKPISILDFVKTISRLTGKKLKYKLVGTAFGEIQRQYLDSSKARRVLGWKPNLTLEDGLRIVLQEAHKNGSYR